ncbi:MAG: hypothetical protein K6A35_05850 [bacterium]|nr:hypothetical protein [bacterium]
MNKFVCGLLTAAVLLGASSTVSAADYDFYVHNRPFKGTAHISSRSVSAALDDVLNALGYTWKVEGNVIAVSSSAHSASRSGRAPAVKLAGGPALTEAMPYQITFNGTPVNLPVDFKAGRVMVDVESLAKAFDLRYKVSDSMGSIDLLVPITKAQAMANMPKPKEKVEDKKDGAAEAKDGKDAKKVDYKLNDNGKIETDGTNAQSSIKVDNFDWYNNEGTASLPPEIHFNTITISNSGDKPVTGITLSVDALRPDDNSSANSWTTNVGTLDPGKTFTFSPEDSVWTNYSRIPVTCKPLITHDPPKEEPKKEETKPEPALTEEAVKAEPVGATSGKPAEESVTDEKTIKADPVRAAVKSIEK